MSNTKAWLIANLICKVGKEETILNSFITASALYQHLEQMCWKARIYQDTTSEKLQIPPEVSWATRLEKAGIAVFSEGRYNLFRRKERPSSCKNTKAKL